MQVSVFSLWRVLCWKEPSRKTLRQYRIFLNENSSCDMPLAMVDFGLLISHRLVLISVAMLICAFNPIADDYPDILLIVMVGVYLVALMTMAINSSPSIGWKYEQSIAHDLTQSAVFITQMPTGHHLVFMYDREKHLVRLYPMTYTRLRDAALYIDCVMTMLPVTLASDLISGNLSPSELSVEETAGVLAGTVYMIDPLLHLDTNS